MTVQEFSDQFDVLFNNITSNQAPGLNEYEKSVFLTKAQSEIVKNYFSAGSAGNNLRQGFDDSAKRQADFSILMKTDYCTFDDGTGTRTITRYTCTAPGRGERAVVYNLKFVNVSNQEVTVPVGTYTIGLVAGNPTITVSGSTVYVKNWPSNVTADDGDSQIVIDQYEQSISNRVHIDPRSTIYWFPTDVFIPINETIKTTDNRILQVIPLRYDEYTRLMSKPFKYPVKNQAWRLMQSGNISNTVDKYVEIIVNLGDTIDDESYFIRYIRTPSPIILANLGDLTIGGLSSVTECELDPNLHEEILQRAVELAKVAWTSNGQDNVNMVIEAGKRSE